MGSRAFVLLAACGLAASIVAPMGQAAPRELTLAPAGTDPRAHANLIVRALPSGEVHTLWVGVHLTQAPGWHTYWRNPGDSGMAPQIVWHLPEGWIAAPIDWPAPERLVAGPLASYGYPAEVVLPTRLSPAASWSIKVPAHLAASVSWLVCREICVPEKAELSLDVPMNLRRADQRLIEHFIARTPLPFDFSAARIVRAGDRLDVELTPARNGTFLPEIEDLIVAGDTPQVKQTGSQVSWSAQLGETGRHLPTGTHIAGIWIEPNRRARRVEAMLENSAP